jgi:cytochrome c oxidase subunit 2
MMPRAWRALAGLCCVAATSACSSDQSAFFPRGEEVAQVNLLFWVLTTGGTIIFLGMIAVAALAIAGPDRMRRLLMGDRLIVGGGIIFPAVTLTAVLAYGLAVMASRATAEGEPGAIRAAIVGEQWWWRVIYTLPDGTSFESANELRIPTNIPVVLELTTADVLHSFWVPNLAGKLDMIPGRTNLLTLTATEPGISRGQCAEYCGGAHAFMSFHVVATSPEEFEAWRRHEAAPAVPPDDPELRQGAELFASLGCGGCHSVRGTDAAGRIGPDLTHVGGRLSLAAATLPNDAEAFANWIANNQHIKPGNRMPPYAILTEAELALLARYLESLE